MYNLRLSFLGIVLSSQRNVLLNYAFVLMLLFSLGRCNKRNVLILLADDAGFETQVYNNSICQTPFLNKLSKKSTVFINSFTSVSSCSPSRSAILTGLPVHQNGMYGLHQSMHHFNSFAEVQSLPKILAQHNIRTGIIGKKHVGPDDVYPFDFAYTEDHHSIMQVGRNITYMKLLAQKFFQTNDDRPFLLYIGFHDPHRCGHTYPQYGPFCERFGDGQPGHGVISDWKPIHYSPEEVVVPYFVQDTPQARADIAAQYTTVSRLDQGIGLILEELRRAGHEDDTLVLYTSDNGIPFPYGRTNFFEPGIREPFLLSSPVHKESWGKENSALISHVDILPTVLDWFHITYPNYTIFKTPVTLTGKSLLPLLSDDNTKVDNFSAVFSSHQLHEITMYYPMRSIRTSRYKLIANLNYLMPFPIDQDFAISPTFLDLLNRTKNKEETHWFSNLHQYYYRQPFQLYDLQNDPKELKNWYGEAKYETIFKSLLKSLQSWQNKTADPWICAPGGVLEKSGCLIIDNGMPWPSIYT